MWCVHDQGRVIETKISPMRFLRPVCVRHQQIFGDRRNIAGNGAPPSPSRARALHSATKREKYADSVAQVGARQRYLCVCVRVCVCVCVCVRVCAYAHTLSLTHNHTRTHKITHAHTFTHVCVNYQGRVKTSEISAIRTLLRPVCVGHRR